MQSLQPQKADASGAKMPGADEATYFIDNGHPADDTKLGSDVPTATDIIDLQYAPIPPPCSAAQASAPEPAYPVRWQRPATNKAGIY